MAIEESKSLPTHSGDLQGSNDFLQLDEKFSVKTRDWEGWKRE